MKETETGIISENIDETRVISSAEFLDGLIYRLGFERVVIIKEGDNIKFESTKAEEIEKAKKLFCELLAEQGD